jgi:hypothetical protein
MLRNVTTVSTELLIAIGVTIGYSVIFWGFWLTERWRMPQLWWDISTPWGPITGRMPLGFYLNALTVFAIAYLGVMLDRRFCRSTISS